MPLRSRSVLSKSRDKLLILQLQKAEYSVLVQGRERTETMVQVCWGGEMLKHGAHNYFQDTLKSGFLFFKFLKPTVRVQKIVNQGLLLF